MLYYHSLLITHDCPQPETTLENLSRLASKPGVQSTLILSKSDGSIIRCTGLLAGPSSLNPQDTLESDGTGPNTLHELDGGSRGDGAEHTDKEIIEAKDTKAQNVARMVFTFVEGAKTFAEGMDSSDEVKLLRLRTRKNEIVIVPGSSALVSAYCSMLTFNRSQIFASSHPRYPNSLRLMMLAIPNRVT